jgi:hypothetical protein
LVEDSVVVRDEYHVPEKHRSVLKESVVIAGRVLLRFLKLTRKSIKLANSLGLIVLCLTKVSIAIRELYELFFTLRNSREKLKWDVVRFEVQVRKCDIIFDAFVSNYEFFR